MTPNTKRLIALLLATNLFAQTTGTASRTNSNTYASGRTQTFLGVVDMGGATRTAPCRRGNGAPTGQNGTQGDCYYNNTGTAGQNLWWATTTGTPATWTQPITGGGSGSGITYCSDATGSTTIYTCPGATGYTLSAGARATFVPQATNTTTTPTVAIAGGAAKTIKYVDGSALIAGQLSAGLPYDLEYNGTDQLLLSLNPSNSVMPGLSNDMYGANHINVASLSGTMANAASTGTTNNRLLIATGTATALIAGTSTISGILGVAKSGGGTTGNVRYTFAGTETCDFDGATTTNHYVIASVTTGGKCHDSGTATNVAPPSGSQIVGQTISTNGGAGAYPMLVLTGSLGGAGGGGGSSIAGFYWLFGGPPAAVTALAVAPGANGGAIYEFSTTARTSTEFIYSVATPGAGGSKILFGIWTSSLTAPVCVTSRGSNAGGAHALTWASGSGVSGGTCTLSGGEYRLVVSSEDTSLAIAAYSDIYVVGFYTVDNVGGASTANNRGGYVTSGVSTGSAGTLAFVSDLSAITWTSTSGTGQLPAVAAK